METPFMNCPNNISLSPYPSLPLVPDDVRREGVFDVDVEPQEVLLGVREQVIVELSRGGDFPPKVTKQEHVILLKEAWHANMMSAKLTPCHIHCLASNQS